jgi:4-hydroxy-tetrahydrodipicolinate reductase
VEKINVIIYGCGVMGQRVAEALLDKESFEIVGAVDIAPELVGKDLGEVINAQKELGVKMQLSSLQLLIWGAFCHK